MITRRMHLRLIGPLLIWAGLAAAASASAATAPEAPDYTNGGAWAAYPGTPSRADEVPAGLTARAPQTRAPVFFIHPTTYLVPVIANAAFAPGGAVQNGVDDVVMSVQASAFNACCAVFAPRYRQASLRAITSNSPEGYAADELAYRDVERAFAQFLKINPTGPLLLAGHSQGSIHGLRLLQERILGTPLQRRLVAAYLIGLALPTDIADRGMPICQSDRATGCVVSWNSVRLGHVDRRREQTSVIWWQGSYQPIAGRPLVCVNPLNWHVDATAPASANMGALYKGGGRGEALPALVPELTGAWCQDGLLGVDIPRDEQRHFRDALSVFGIYHDFDYGLFYGNIRQNAVVRAGAWQDTASKP